MVDKQVLLAKLEKMSNRYEELMEQVQNGSTDRKVLEELHRLDGPVSLYEEYLKVSKQIEELEDFLKEV